MSLSFLRRRDVFSWCLYDWANSAFVTSIITVVLPVYFLSLVPQEGPVVIDFGPLHHETSGIALWNYLTAAYMLAAGLASPFLGAIADYLRAKKRFLAICVFAGVLLTAGLWFAADGRYMLCALLFVPAAFLWTCGNLFYDSLLPGLSANEREMDAISSAGYAIGYLGGGLLLAINLVMVQKPEWFGFADVTTATRAVFVTVALWWFCFSIPVLNFVPEPAREAISANAAHPIRSGLRHLWTTLQQVRQYRQLARLLVAFIFYNTGIGTVITVAAAFGKDELGLETGTLIACILVIQFVGFPASFAFIGLARWLGTKGAIYLGLIVYIVVVVLGYTMDSATDFWFLGILIGLVQGGTQALSRSLYGSMIPEGHSAEFFGFFSIFNKVGSFAGPLAFAAVRDITNSSRLAILFLAGFFIIGLAILFSVRPGRTGNV